MSSLADNPLLQDWGAPHGLPPFDRSGRLLGRIEAVHRQQGWTTKAGVAERRQQLHLCGGIHPAHAAVDRQR